MQLIITACWRHYHEKNRDTGLLSYRNDLHSRCSHASGCRRFIGTVHQRFPDERKPVHRYHHRHTQYRILRLAAGHLHHERRTLRPAPVIAGGTENVVKDPEGGPYTIGSYQYNNGNGRTIIDDVAPSTANMSNTNYYAQVTTDSTGTAIVQFQTSAYTAIRSYSVKTENPANPESENYNVEEKVYSQGSKPMINTPVQTIATYPSRPSLTTTPATLSPTTGTTTMPVPTTTPIPTTTKKSPLESGIAIVAVIAGFAAILRR